MKFLGLMVYAQYFSDFESLPWEVRAVVSIPVYCCVIELLAVHVPVQPLYGHRHLYHAYEQEWYEHHGQLDEVDVRHGHEGLLRVELIIGIHEYECGKAGQRHQVGHIIPDEVEEGSEPGCFFQCKHLQEPYITTDCKKNK